MGVGGTRARAAPLLPRVLAIPFAVVHQNYHGRLRQALRDDMSSMRDGLCITVHVVNTNGMESVSKSGAPSPMLFGSTHQPDKPGIV